MSTVAGLLRVEALAKRFGGVEAVAGISFAVAAGELVALIGPNGAGKTTCFNLINGQLRPDAGAVYFADERIDGMPLYRIAHVGIGRTFQVAATWGSMTVRENLQLALLALGEQEPGGDGHRRSRGWGYERGYGRVAARLAACRRDAADALLARVGVAHLAEQGCASLAYGDAKRVELALALAGAPRLLLMDEPTAGMAPAARREVMHLAATLVREQRIAVLFTEHDMDVVFGYADRVIVLDRGHIVAAGTPAAVRADPRVRAVYLGEDDAG